MYKEEEMKEAIYDWLEQLACYLILITAVIHTLPDSGYKKYIRFFTGLVLILLLASPVLRLFQIDLGEWEFYPSKEYSIQLEEIEKAKEDFDEERAGIKEKSDQGNLVEVEEIRIGR